MAIATAERMTQLNEELLHGDLLTRAEAAYQLGEATPPVNQDWTITICDKLWRPEGSINADIIELSGTDPRNNLPSAALKLKGSSE
jgi:hypothetical protein